MIEPRTGTPTRGKGTGNNPEQNQILERVHNALVEYVSLEDVANEIMTAIREGFKLERVAIILESDIGIRSYTQSCEEPAQDDAVSLIKTAGQALCLYESMEESPVRELLRKHGFLIGTPLTLKKLNLAALFLGKKVSGESFAIEEVQFLDDVASDISAGIGNAEAYDVLKTFLSEIEAWDERMAIEMLTKKRLKLQKDQELESIREEFASIATRRLLTPIQAIQGLLLLPEGSRGNLKKDIEQNLVTIEDAYEDICQIMNDFLATARAGESAIRSDMPVRESKPTLEYVLKDIIRDWKVQLARHDA